jgi:hypothetical protein
LQADTAEVHSRALACAIWERVRPHVTTHVHVREGEPRWERETVGEWSA